MPSIDVEVRPDTIVLSSVIAYTTNLLHASFLLTSLEYLVWSKIMKSDDAVTTSEQVVDNNTANNLSSPMIS